MSDDDPFLPEHEPAQFEAPQPLKCPPYEADLSQSCPYLHCIDCKFKLARGPRKAAGKTSYSCFQCDAVFITTD